MDRAAEGWLGTLQTVGNDGEFILLRLVPGEPYGFAWDKLKKLIRPLDDARQWAKHSAATPSTWMDPHPFSRCQVFTVPLLQGSCMSPMIATSCYWPLCAD